MERERFVDKIALVTGGANGLGRGMVEQLVKEGAQVAIFDIEDDTRRSFCALRPLLALYPIFEKEGKERGHCARSGENNIRGGLYEGREGMLATMRAKFADGVTSSHQGHHHWIELTGEETARSHWSLQDDLYDAQRGGEFVGRAHYDNEYVKIDGRWYFAKMSLTYLRGEANIKKRYEDCANAYQVFMM